MYMDILIVHTPKLKSKFKEFWGKLCSINYFALSFPIMNLLILKESNNEYNNMPMYVLQLHASRFFVVSQDFSTPISINIFMRLRLAGLHNKFISTVKERERLLHRYQ